jgi:hypothetical protein
MQEIYAAAPNYMRLSYLLHEYIGKEQRNRFKESSRFFVVLIGSNSPLSLSATTAGMSTIFTSLRVFFLSVMPA